jgi:two-component system chemotaxis sensor kinase CheA
MARDALRDTFFAECEDLLEAVAQGLSELAAGSDSSDTINAVFRAVHSIKGAAGAFDLTALVSFSHRFETVLDAARSGRLAIDAGVLDVASRAGDVLARLVEAAREGTEADQGEVEATLAALDALLGPADLPAENSSFDFAPLSLDFAPLALEPLTLDPPGATRWEIAFVPRPGFHENGHDALHYLQALSDLGAMEVHCDLDRLPSLDALDPEESYLAWLVTLKTDQTAAQIEEVFAFAEGLCDLEIRPASEVDPASALEVSAAPEHELPLVSPKSPPAPEPDPTPAPQPSALGPRAEAKPPKDDGGEGARPTLRVEIDRVDRLVNTVGELIINQAAITERLSAVPGPLPTDLLSGLDDYKLLARQIQEAVMAIRAQPVRPLFQRMARIVREASRATGKPVQLVTDGEGTEVDRTVVEHLADPLTHMVRNAIDHGLEPPEARAAAGKPAQGTVWLSAEHQSGSVVIRVRDDGAGLDRDRIRATAIRKGLISPEAELAPSEIDNLLFMPGFSTAASVTNLSGRGVGLDVVKTAITALGGRIGIETTPGAGSTFSLILPLTLAVMDGMLVTVAGQDMVVPLSGIQETIRPDVRQLRPIGRDGHLLTVQDEQVPVVDLAARLGRREGSFDPSDHILLLVRSQAGVPFALAVEGITDQRQVVIKSLRDNYGRIPGVSAATVLGDGRIALIVDPDSIVATTAARQPAFLE